MTDGAGSETPPDGGPGALTAATLQPQPGGQGDPRPRNSRYPQTALALIGAVIGCLAIVAFIVLVVVRPDNMQPTRVDWHAAAVEASSELGPSVLDPRLPDGWTANFAEVDRIAEVPTWRIGLLSPSGGYVGLKQGFVTSSAEGADLPWREAALADHEPNADPVVVRGLAWQVVDRRDEADAGNYAYAMMTTFDEAVVVLHGDASDAEFQAVAEVVAVAWMAR